MSSVRLLFSNCDAPCHHRPGERRLTPPVFLTTHRGRADALEGVAAIFPAVREHYEGGASKCWDEDPWARGAYAWFAPGDMSSLLPHVARAEGRVHFAGEHASSLPGWMHGALESGNRVAREGDEAPS